MPICVLDQVWEHKQHSDARWQLSSGDLKMWGGKTPEQREIAEGNAAADEFSKEGQTQMEERNAEEVTTVTKRRRNQVTTIVEAVNKLEDISSPEPGREQQDVRSNIVPLPLPLPLGWL